MTDRPDPTYEIMSDWYSPASGTHYVLDAADWPSVIVTLRDPLPSRVVYLAVADGLDRGAPSDREQYLARATVLAAIEAKVVAARRRNDGEVRAMRAGLDAVERALGGARRQS